MPLRWMTLEASEAEKVVNAEKALRLAQPTALIYRFDDQFARKHEAESNHLEAPGQVYFALPLRPLLNSTHLLLKAGALFCLHLCGRFQGAGRPCGRLADEARRGETHYVSTSLS